MSQDRSRRFWQHFYVWLPAALLAVFLWGSAAPALKISYGLFGIADGRVPDLLLFAGLRFLLAGLLTLLFFRLQAGRPQDRLSDPTYLKDVAILACFQTVIQYALFFIGMARSGGATGSIMSSLQSFIAVILVGLFVPGDRLSLKKIAGCLLGLAGILVLNGGFGSGGSGMTLAGEGVVFLSAAGAAVGNIFSKGVATRRHPGFACGYQMSWGGLVLGLVGLLAGGRIEPQGAGAWWLFIYLAVLSAVAFSLWTVMLRYHDVSRLSMMQALIPVTGTILSGLFLHEDVFRLNLLLALVLVVVGIVVLNGRGRGRRDE